MGPDKDASFPGAGIQRRDTCALPTAAWIFPSCTVELRGSDPRFAGYIMPRLGLAVCLFEMGEVDAAQKEAADALRLVPGFSISRHLAVSGYRKEEHSARRLRAFQALKLVDR